MRKFQSKDKLVKWRANQRKAKERKRLQSPRSESDQELRARQMS